ncbi:MULTISPECIES: helix-turn-helix domain-containing protein [Pelosinus]|uniref:XRE family transcriptional regulator n=1 Tax=Pelosinus fermentans B4 TaxID=1149862 RepID=I9B2Z3_9FIRM|nr:MULTISPECIES: helix-turn-helix transcriptional regulator [Pelosinus]EIW19502.1 XRE family transcriptional regulator [Pelosinus fermentans B4]EIW24765.1 putative transcriptional regulator, XRE family [Pelosinus fermentans A11]OAM95954.1 putative transcriptional regulator, XRE family [Pelosinus fermentans DSM 17108]SDR34707.1 putative transcriptional regulator [Pelosinus fermentans]
MIKFKLDRIMFEKDKIKVPKLQELSGVNKNTLYAIYNNTATRVDLSVLNRLCAALNCQPGDLLEYVPSQIEE